jgi:peptidyl-prolyl cis-trans isomerase SurA
VFEWPKGADADQKQALMTQAEAARGKIAGCTGLDELAVEIGSPGSGDLGTVKPGDLPPRIRDVVLSLPIGQASAPIEVPGGLSILIVCERTDSGIDRDKIRDRLSAQRLDMLARRYMRDLRRSANVDIRL